MIQNIQPGSHNPTCSVNMAIETLTDRDKFYHNFRHHIIPLKLKTKRLRLNPQILVDKSSRQYLCFVLNVDNTNFKAIVDKITDNILNHKKPERPRINTTTITSHGPLKPTQQ